MENNLTDLAQAVMEQTFKDGEKVKLNCAAAFRIAKKFDVKISEIGDICNDRDIRISRCQLGCF